MKILQIIPTLNRGGAEKIAITLANGLSKQQEVVLCTLFDEKSWNRNNFKSEVDNVKIVTFGKKLGFDLKINFKLLFFIIKNRPDVVHSHMSSINYLIISYVLLFFGKVKFFHTIHNDADKEIFGKVDWFLKKYIYKLRFANPICISKTSNKSFFETFGMEGSVIENCIVEPRLSKNSDEVECFIRDLKSKHKYVLVNVGRISNQKNQVELVKAVNSLNENGQNIGLIIVGGKRPGEESVYEALYEVANENIYMVGEKDNATDYLFYTDAFILPSKHEGMPITLLEALSLGCVPICTHVGGIMDVIVDGHNGFVVDNINAECIKDGIMKFIRNDASVKEQCIRTFKERYNYVDYIQRHLKLYNR